MPFVVFDIVGTCFTYANFYSAIATRLGPSLEKHNISPLLFGYSWVEVSEREWLYLSMSKRYKSFQVVFRSLFYRTLTYAGIPDARSFASDDDLDYILDAWRHLTPREGLHECFAKLQRAGFDVWGFTTGDLKRVEGYFESVGIDMKGKVKSCDGLEVGKPDPKAYGLVMGELKALHGEGAEAWFAAAHMWDTTAAGTCGFKSAYCSQLEVDPCYDIFGKPEAEGDTLVTMADAIIAKSESSRK